VALLIWAASIPSHGAAASMGPVELLIPRLLAPAVTNGIVVVAYGETRATTIGFYDAESGCLLWGRSYPGTSFVSELRTCANLLYAPTFRSGVCVFDIRNGTLRRRLPDVGGALPQVCCVRDYAFVAGNERGAVIVTALETTRFRTVWRRRFTGRHLREFRAAREEVEVLLAQGTAELHSGAEWVILRARDGVTLRRAPAAGGTRAAAPRELSPAAHRRLSLLLERRKGTTIHTLPHTRILLFNELAVVGIPHMPESRARLIALRADSGTVAWERHLPGLAGMALSGSKLVLSYEAQGAEMSGAQFLEALDVRTGERLWVMPLGASAGPQS